MGLAIGQTAASSAQGAHARQPNFGALVSAIDRDDLDGARDAFAALTDLAPKRPGPLRQGALDAMDKALGDGDLTEAKKALKQLQQAHLGKPSAPPPAPPAPASGLAAGSTISIMV